MDLYIIVRGSDNRSVKVAVRATGVVGKGTLRDAFQLEEDVAIGLFREDIALERRRDGDEFIFVLGTEWKGAEFELKWEEARRSRPSTSAERGDKLVGSCVLFNDRYILTAAHLSFKLQQSYNIEGTEGRSFKVKCNFICTLLDFAILQSDELPNLRLPIDHLRRGHKYFIMGYPSGIDTTHPTITKGIIEGIMDDCIHLIGTPGSKRGYSGAPVFSDSGKLVGLLLGGTAGLSVNTTIQECLDSSAEQKYARILPITLIVHHHKQGISDSES
ncbi:hypothetical protein FO519_007160 [Halicephalobus sp. NKZ332]|nr:hypothetical protein FO519_007160 [Halicephalobus sp. NKZ332]